MMKPTIREAEIGDSDALNELFARLDEQHSDRLPWLFQPVKTPRSREFFESVLADERAAVFVAISDRLAGFVHVRLSKSPDLPNFVPQVKAIIDALFVDPGYRRKGIATELLRAAETWAESHGATGVELSVYEFNREAYELFSASGYRTLRRSMSKALE